MDETIPHAGLLDLDPETLSSVLEYVSLPDLCRIACTCSYLRDVLSTRTHAVWKLKAEELLGAGLANLHASCVSKMAQRNTKYWRHICRNSWTLPAVTWWDGGGRRLRQSNFQVCKEVMGSKLNMALQLHGAALAQRCSQPGEAEQQQDWLRDAIQSNSHASRKGIFARCGHTATALDESVLIVGGMQRTFSWITDVFLIDLRTLQVTFPRVIGGSPPNRWCHTVTPVTVTPGSLLESMVVQQLQLPLTLENGLAFLVCGGQTQPNQGFGGRDVQLLWIARDKQHLQWLPLTCQGDAPTPRHSHIAEAFSEGTRVALIGGTLLGNQNQGSEELELIQGLGVPVFILDVNNLTWRCERTNVISVDFPRFPSHHFATVRVAPETQQEELIICGGCSRGMLTRMIPWALDLKKLTWHCAPMYLSAPVPYDSLPPPRRRPGVAQVSSKWMLVLGGVGDQDLPLEDMHKLHLPTLTWGTPPAVYGRPLRGLNSVQDMTLEGLVAFGGAVPTVLGMSPVLKTDVLLIGDVPPVDAELLIPEWAESEGLSGKAGHTTEQDDGVAGRKRQRSRRHINRTRKVQEVSLGMSDVQLRLWRDGDTGQLYANRPTGSDFSDSTCSCSSDESDTSKSTSHVSPSAFRSYATSTRSKKQNNAPRKHRTAAQPFAAAPTFGGGPFGGSMFRQGATSYSPAAASPNHAAGSSYTAMSDQSRHGAISYSPVAMGSGPGAGSSYTAMSDHMRQVQQLGRMQVPSTSYIGGVALPASYAAYQPGGALPGGRTHNLSSQLRPAAIASGHTSSQGQLQPPPGTAFASSPSVYGSIESSPSQESSAGYSAAAASSTSALPRVSSGSIALQHASSGSASVSLPPHSKSSSSSSGRGSASGSSSKASSTLQVAPSRTRSAVPEASKAKNSETYAASASASARLEESGSVRQGGTAAGTGTAASCDSQKQGLNGNMQTADQLSAIPEANQSSLFTVALLVGVVALLIALWTLPPPGNQSEF